MKHVGQECHRAGRLIAGYELKNAGASLLAEILKWIPWALDDLDGKIFIPEFTVGFLVEAQKR